MEDIQRSVRSSTINNIAGGHRSKLSKYVDTSCPAKLRMLNILCHQLALYDDARNEVNEAGTCVVGPTGIKPHPAINICRNASDMVLRYMDRLGLGKEAAEVVSSIDDILQKR